MRAICLKSGSRTCSCLWTSALRTQSVNRTWRPPWKDWLWVAGWISHLTESSDNVNGHKGRMSFGLDHIFWSVITWVNTVLVGIDWIFSIEPLFHLEYPSTFLTWLIHCLKPQHQLCLSYNVSFFFYQCFLASKDGEKHLGQVREHLERGREQVPPEQLAHLKSWLGEQEKELATFRTHCQGRQSQLDTVLRTLNR